MRQPPHRVLLLGHPVVAMPVLGLCAFLLYGWSQHPEAWPVGGAALLFGGWTMRACETANQYRAWRKAWDSMAEPIARRALSNHLGKLVIAALVVGGFTLADMGAIPGGTGSALMGIAIVAAPLATLAMLMKRWRSSKARRTTAQVEPVRIAITRPAFPMPSLEDAYASLPEHSQRVMLS